PSAAASHLTYCATGAAPFHYDEGGQQIDPIWPVVYWSSWQVCSYRYTITCDIYVNDGTRISIYEDRYNMDILIHYKNGVDSHESHYQWSCDDDAVWVDFRDPTVDDVAHRPLLT